MKNLSPLFSKHQFNISTALLLFLACTFSMIQPVLADTSFSEIKELTSKKISIYKKYDELLESITVSLKSCAPSGPGVPEEALKFTEAVVSYGKFLEKTDSEDFNKLTIHNPVYWNAYFALITNDSTVLITREYFLMREGLLEQAEIVLFFTILARNRMSEEESFFIMNIEEDIQKITESSNNYVEKGIKYWDKGKQKKAHNLYFKALEIYPKNPGPIYELNLTNMVKNMDKIASMKVDLSLLKLVREYAPLYRAAYQGRMTPELRKASLALYEKVLPSYEALLKGENMLQNLEIFADGCVEMELYEYAIYAYRLLLFHDPSKDFDEKIINKINNCLDKLNASESKEFLKSLLGFMSEYIKKMNE